MSNAARAGVFGLMVLAIVLARLIEVEVRPQSLSVGAKKASAQEPQKAPKPITPQHQPAPDLDQRQAQPPEPQPANAGRPRGGRTYVVQPGDTLGGISKKAYGTTRHWQAILDANRDVIPSESKMRAGVELKLPKVSR